MRTTILALFILAAPLLAEEKLAVPAGATLYFEVNGLAGRTEAVLGSPLYAAIQQHPAMKKFLESPEGQRLKFGQGMLRGMIGVDAQGLLKEIGKGRIVGAMYGLPEHSVLLVEMDPKLAHRIAAGLEFAGQAPRTEIVPQDEAGPPLFRVGKAYVCIGPEHTIVSANEDLARRVRAGEGGTMDVAHARRLVPGNPLVFGVIDLRPFHKQYEKPKDFGQALFLGALPHDVRQAPWAAFSFDLQVEGAKWIVRSDARVPTPENRTEGAVKAFGGTLDDLPFALPEGTFAVARMKRNLKELWQYQDDLIAENALPELVKFSSNFQTLTGLTFTEELLPRLGDEVTLIAASREFGGKAPELKLPHMALLWPVETDERMRQSIDLAFQQVFSLIGIQQAEMSRKFMVMREIYKDVPIMTARYPVPSEGEMKGRRALPIRYNFEPAAAVVGDTYVLASTKEMLQRLIDGREGRTAAPAGKNAGLWIEPRKGMPLLAANRQALVANRMLEEGEDRETADGVVGILLELGAMFADVSFTADEGKASLGLGARIVLEAK